LLLTQSAGLQFRGYWKYLKVRRTCRPPDYRRPEFTDDEVDEFCSGLAYLNQRGDYPLQPVRKDGISPFRDRQRQCISYDLLVQEFGDDRLLMEFLMPDDRQTLGGALITERLHTAEGPGQRNTCRCILSKDIGSIQPACTYFRTASQYIPRTCQTELSRYIVGRDRGYSTIR